MHYTIFDTPVLSSFLYLVSTTILKIFGWKKEGCLPDASKYVVIAAPHTSNWDLPITMLVAFAFKTKIFWMGKDALFRFPFGHIMRWLGGIPVDRSKSNNMVDQTIQAFNSHERLAITVPPEGTRGKVRSWKTGFYYIAYGANVPIVLCFLDYDRKVGGVGPVFWPSGDIVTDMCVIREFYYGIRGKHPEKSGLADISPGSGYKNACMPRK